MPGYEGLGLNLPISSSADLAKIDADYAALGAQRQYQQGLLQNQQQELALKQQQQAFQNHVTALDKLGEVAQWPSEIRKVGTKALRNLGPNVLDPSLLDLAESIDPSHALQIGQDPRFHAPLQQGQPVTMGTLSPILADIGRRARAQDAAQDQEPSSSFGTPQGWHPPMALPNAAPTSVPTPPGPASAPASPPGPEQISAIDARVDHINAQLQQLAEVERMYGSPTTKARVAALTAEKGTLETRRQSLGQVHMAPPYYVGYNPQTGYTQPPQPPGAGPLPLPKKIGAGLWAMPEVNEQTGGVKISYKFEPNFNPSQLTHEDALVTLVAEGKLPADAQRTELKPDQQALVARRLTQLQADAAGQKAANVTVHTGMAKLDLPLGDKSQSWLNAKGEMPSPDMSQNAATAAGFRPYKDAVKRLDQEGASRTFMMHLQFLREKAAPLFPEATGNVIGDAAVGQTAALARRALGQSHPAVAAIMAIDRPAALQMTKAVAPDARSGARLVQMFEELTNPYQPWTQKSYTAALDALQQMAVTGMAQRGRPGMNPQPGPNAVPPASAFDKSPAATGPKAGPPRILRITPVPAQ